MTGESKEPMSAMAMIDSGAKLGNITEEPQNIEEPNDFQIMLAEMSAPIKVDGEDHPFAQDSKSPIPTKLD